MGNANQQIKRLIMALLAKASGTDNEHEAEAFLAKAMELMQEHQLNIVDMVDAGDPILDHVGMSQAESGHAWRWKLYSAVAQLYGCKSIHVRQRRPYKGKYVPWYEQHLVGRESAIITTDLMYPWIADQVRKAGRAVAALTGMSEQGQAKRVAAALIERIYKLVADQAATEPTTPSGRNALLVLNQVVAKFDELYPTAQDMASRPSVTDRLARDAANGIGLHRQASHAAQLKIGGG